MPYIPVEKRMEPSVVTSPSTPGELNYAVTRLAERYRALKGDSYETFNAIIGALECCKLENYRRVASPYENGACEVNGDVYKPSVYPSK